MPGEFRAGGPQARPSAEQNALADQFIKAQDTLTQQAKDAQGVLEANQAAIDQYANATQSAIENYNSQKAEVSILAGNSGSSSQSPHYYQADAPLAQKTSPLVYLGAAFAAYFLFFKKGH